MSQDRKSSSPDQKLEARLALLEELFVRFAQTGTVEHTLGQGFDAMSGHLCTLNDRLENIAAELTPLRRLSGPTVPYEEGQREHLASLIAAHARPQFRNVTMLTDGRGGLRFIGDPAPARDDGPHLIENRSIAS